MAATVAAAGGWGSGRGVRILSAHRKAGGRRSQEALAVGGGVAGEGGGVPQPRRRARLRSLHPHGLLGRLGPSARQGGVEGVRGGDKGEGEVRRGQVAGTGGEWQQEPPGMVSDYCVLRAQGGLGERRPPAREFGNGQHRAASAGRRWSEGCSSHPRPAPLVPPPLRPPPAAVTHNAWARLHAPETRVAAAATAAGGGAGGARGPGRGVRHAGGGCCW